MVALLFLHMPAVGGSMPASSFGVAGGWSGARATKNLTQLFPDVTGTADKRAQFYTSGQNLEIANLTDFTDGLAVTKYRNVKRDSSTKWCKARIFLMLICPYSVCQKCI